MMKCRYQKRTKNQFLEVWCYVYLWLIHVEEWQKLTPYYKAVIFQFKIKKFFKGVIKDINIKKKIESPTPKEDHVLDSELSSTFPFVYRIKFKSLSVRFSVLRDSLWIWHCSGSSPGMWRAGPLSPGSRIIVSMLPISILTPGKTPRIFTSVACPCCPLKKKSLHQFLLNNRDQFLFFSYFYVSALL